MARQRIATRADAIRVAQIRLAIVDGSAWKVFEEHGCTYEWLGYALKVAEKTVINWFEQFNTPQPGIALMIAEVMERLEKNGGPLAGLDT